MVSHYEDTKRNTLFNELINLKQNGLMTEHIENFQRLNIKVNDILEQHMIDVFMGTLKDNIKHKFCFGKLIHWGRHSGWKEKMKEKL